MFAVLGSSVIIGLHHLGVGPLLLLLLNQDVALREDTVTLHSSVSINTHLSQYK